MSQSDQLLRFLFRERDVRGEVVKVGASLDAMLAGHQYPQPVKQLLAELVAATSLLTATLKFEGQIAVQLQGDGPVRFIAVNGNDQQQFRGVARLQSEIQGDSFAELIGQGYMLVTITPNQGERYQGIIPLVSDSLTATLEAYFNQSEQLPTRLYLHTEIGEQQSQAAGLLLQVLPVDQEKSREDFAHIELLADTLTREELLTLAPEESLYRLFHQEIVELFPAQPVQFVCGCSRDKSESAIISLGADVIDEYIAEGKLDISCEYCNTIYHFDAADLQQLKQKF
ncbi:Hsp33 family molecular chaperone HslO [Rheinheimera texasensis]|uniref:Hsp33 family molecular chaperone HslO n=1 Tax=Rheinheimera texasensis TaxID=306205 RepID=UPI0032B15DA3